MENVTAIVETCKNTDPKLPGSKLSAYMDLLGITISKLSELTFLEENELEDILTNRTPWESVDPVDQFLICSALRCLSRRVESGFGLAT